MAGMHYKEGDPTKKTWRAEIQLRCRLDGCRRVLPRACRKLEKGNCTYIVWRGTIGVELPPPSIGLDDMNEQEVSDHLIGYGQRKSVRGNDAQRPHEPSRAPSLRAGCKPCTIHCWTCNRNAYTSLRDTRSGAFRSCGEVGHTLQFLCRLDVFLHLECLARVDDVNDCTWPCSLEVLQERSGVSPVRVRGVDTLR